MSYVIIHRKGDKTTITRVHDNGKTELLSAPPKGRRQPHVSESNGFIGTRKDKKARVREDTELGVRDCVEYIPTGYGAYRAHYPSVHDFDRWMHAHQRVNYNAGYRTPAPGDFGGTNHRLLRTMKGKG